MQLIVFVLLLLYNKTMPGSEKNHGRISNILNRSIYIFQDSVLTLVLLVADLDKKKVEKRTRTLTYWYSSDRTQQEFSNEYQHDRVRLVVLWTKM